MEVVASLRSLLEVGAVSVAQRLPHRRPDTWSVTLRVGVWISGSLSLAIDYA